MPQFSRRFNVLWQVAARDIAAEDAAAALSEDIGDGDISAGLVLANTRGTGLLYARESAVLCGREWFEECFLQLDTTAEFVWHAEEGGEVTPGMIVGETRAGFRALLGGERSALNFLQTLSATAGVAREMQQLAGDVLVVDTRKTLPKLRAAQKYAVRIGGAHNHRHGLFDEILIKENHAAAAGGITAAWQKARQITDDARIQVEVRTFAELEEALSAGVRRIIAKKAQFIRPSCATSRKYRVSQPHTPAKTPSQSDLGAKLGEIGGGSARLCVRVDNAFLADWLIQPISSLTLQGLLIAL